MLTWIVGAGGLLGGALGRRFPERFTASPVPWSDHDVASATLRSDAARFAAQAGDRDWAVLWAAGSGVVATSASELHDQFVTFQRFVRTFRDVHPAGRGVFFLASSAGGVYAGAKGPPFTEHTVPVPVSPYGRTKLRQEVAVEDAIAGVVPVVVGRLSNLFGPGQKLEKPQGLIGQLCLAAVSRRPLNLYVPMDTIRDYLYVDDAAAWIRAHVERVAAQQSTGLVVRNIASERAVPMGAVLRIVQQVAHRRVLVALGSDSASRFQVRDLRIASVHGGEVAVPSPTTLPVGIRRVYEDTLARLETPAPRTPRTSLP